jgi:hypothetical protein
MQTEKADCETLFFEAVSLWLSHSSMRRCPETEVFKAITGILERPEYSAKIEIIFRPSKLKASVPRVFCDEAWIFPDLDWHCIQHGKTGEYFDGRNQLCWIHPREWNLAHNYREKRLRPIVSEGAEWLKNNLSRLLDCHWAGHTLGIKKWRREWGEWSHGDEGTKEFEREVQGRRVPKNWN